jgi:hypothetical protein
MAQLLKREVADHLVGVHVGRGAGAALDHVDHEFVEQLASDEVVAGQDDGGGAVAVDGAQVGIGARGGLLYQRQGAHQVGHGRHAGAGDRKVLDRTRGVHAPVGEGRNLLFAEEVVFGPEIGAHTGSSAKKKHAGGACRKTCCDSDLKAAATVVAARPQRQCRLRGASCAAFIDCAAHKFQASTISARRRLGADQV